MVHLSACKIYTDSSGINSLVRYTAVSLNLPTVYKDFMGIVTESAIPITELAGLILAFQIAKELPFWFQDLEIYINNQRAH